MTFDPKYKKPSPLSREQASWHSEEVTKKDEELTDVSRYVPNYAFRLAPKDNTYPATPYMFWNPEAEPHGGSVLPDMEDEKEGSAKKKMYKLFMETYPHDSSTNQPCYGHNEMVLGDAVKGPEVEETIVGKKGKLSNQHPAGYPNRGQEHAFVTNLLAGISGDDATRKRALRWAHRLILQNDASRFPAGEGAARIKEWKKSSDANVKKLATLSEGAPPGMDSDANYKLETDMERNLMLLECLPRTSRAFYALRWVHKIGEERIEDCAPWDRLAAMSGEAQNKEVFTTLRIGKARSRKDVSADDFFKTGINKFDKNAKVFVGKRSGEDGLQDQGYEIDRYMNVYTPTARDRATWVLDVLSDNYNIVYTPRVKTHREPLAGQWNKCRNVYGKGGPISEDGLIQFGHYMRVGRKTGETNTFFDSQEIFWLSNMDPPEGSISAWIPDHVGGVREVWFSDAATDADEEKYAFDDGRVPYMRYETQKQARSWEMWVPNEGNEGLEATQRVPRKPALRLVPALPVYNINTKEYEPSTRFEDLPVAYYPSVGLQDPDARPLGAAAASTIVQASTYNPTLYQGYNVASLQAPGAASGDYSDYDYSDDYSGEYNDNYGGDYSDDDYSADF